MARQIIPSLILAISMLAPVANAEDDFDLPYEPYNPRTAAPSVSLPKPNISDVSFVEPPTPSLNVASMGAAASQASDEESDDAEMDEIDEEADNQGSDADYAANKPEAALPAPTATEASLAPVGAVISGIAKVIDGHTMSVDGIVLRLHGADAPGIAQHCYSSQGLPWECGKRSMAMLQDLVAGINIKCIVIEDYKTSGSAICSTYGIRDVGEHMVLRGGAIPNGHDRGAYMSALNIASASKVGILNSSFEKPWLWRAKNEAPKAAN